MAQFYPALHTPLNIRTYHIRILGVNGANPTKQEGDGVTVTRVSEGLYEITWASNPFQFIGALSQLMCTTVADLKDTEVIFGDYNATTKKLRFTVFETGTAADLIATERLYIQVIFSESGV